MHQTNTPTPTRYPFDIPTEAFPFERFRQAFAAVQASVVHLQARAQRALTALARV